MNDTMVTVVGNVVDQPRLNRTGDSTVTNFRVASTARRYDAATGGFVDGRTLYVDVECWNTMSGRVSGSIAKGDPVIVHGMLSTHEWETEAGRRSKPQIRATAVGPDLARCTVVVTRVRRPADGTTTVETEEGVVDTATGELTTADRVPDGDGEPAARDDLAALLSGRDYVDASAALHEPTDDGLPAEPAHA